MDSRSLSVSLSVPFLTLSRERKGAGSWKLAGRKSDDPWPHVEVKRSQIKTIRPQVETDSVSKRQPQPKARMKALVANMVTEDKFPSCLDLLDPPNNGKNKYSLGSSFQSFIKKDRRRLGFVDGRQRTGDGRQWNRATGTHVDCFLLLQYYVCVCVILSVTTAVNILCVYYGWQVPMVLAFRQPSVDIFAMCLIICRISLW